MPVLVTEGGTALFESDAIFEYIDGISAPLVAEVKPEQRAIDRAWSYQASKHHLVQCSTMQSANKETLAERNDKMNQAFAKAEKQLSTGPFFNGETMGNVNVAWFPLLHRALIIEQHTGFDFFADFPKVKAWQSTMAKTGLAERSVSADFDEAFSNLYLAEKTFLGRGANFNEAQIEIAAAKGGGCCG